MGSQERLWQLFGPEVPRWIATAWPFGAPRFVEVDLSWQEWLALPEQP